MKDDILEYYLDAGRIASSILQEGSSFIRPGVTILEVVEKTEDMVAAKGAELAFPLNISINECAAHDTASKGDMRVFNEGEMVKFDLGVHIDGYIADIATTVDLGDHSQLLEASRAALEAAIALVQPGIRVGELGGAIQEEIEKRGFHPVVNLTGHGLDRFVIHRSPNVPNIRIAGSCVLEEDMVFAIEPFASSGSGVVSDRKRTEIFRQIGLKPVRLPAARRILDEIGNRHGLPFARRWLAEEHPDIPIRHLLSAGLLHPYPVLADLPGSFVSQHEHTIIVTDGGSIVTTR
jgi:methionyl aminopeptidase